jgi:valyl-tRNA synthetase
MPDYTLSKSYDFNEVEGRIYTWWESKGFFNADIREGEEPYVISMPPPNITGELHNGHALFVAFEDLMTRHARMLGYPTLWLPGTDHAGIATQLQVEKYLLETQNRRREEIDREEFESLVWDWKEKYGGIITQQLRRLGASCDWRRERFTLDDGLSLAVREAFVRLYDKGLIYRGNYLINWSPGLKTAVSDLEVEYQEEEGQLYYFKYRVEGSDAHIPVATTRPETILGDTAVAIHPDDNRYADLIGMTCLVPILERPIPVIADNYVDLEFGTGALKITPGHDPADYEISRRHELEIINVLNPDASMNEAAGPYQGLDRFECRKKLWADMEAAGLTIKTEPYTIQIPRSQRGGEIIEPMMSTQWFVRMEPLAKPALNAVRSGDIKIIPERFEKVYFNWLENIRDWCISRQLWWGHRIPAWHCSDCGEITVARDYPGNCSHCSSKSIEQDPDVLDTWFSSGLWPFSTLGWPEETDDYRYFYPTTMMETGYDILFFWVARMIMMGLEFTGTIPFHSIYLHGLVRAGSGEKMSKSLGNVQDPLELMDQYGTDALRFMLLTGSTPGQDTRINVERLEASRNFANKLWNAGRLILSTLEQTPDQPAKIPELSFADRWIVARESEVISEISRLFESHQYGEAGRQLYEFFWSEFADWYLEIAKLQIDEGEDRRWLTTQVMLQVYETCLRLLHPFIPFVTEELWGTLRKACQAQGKGIEPRDGWGEALIVAHWPEHVKLSFSQKDAVAEFSVVIDIVTAIRNVRAEKNVAPQQRIAAMIHAGARYENLLSARSSIESLAGIDSQNFRIEASLDRPETAISLVVHDVDIYLPIEGMVDLDEERARLKRELDEVASQIKRLEELLMSPFAERAPESVVENEKSKLQNFKETQRKLKTQLKDFG